MSSPADALAAMQAIVAEARTATIEELGKDATLWLAVAPVWTVETAAAAGFPADSVVDFVEHACEVGWCETRGSRSDPADGLRFWMPEETRREVIEAIGAGTGSQTVQQEAREIAQHVQQLDVAVPPTLLSWAEMMTADAPDRVLVDQARQATEDDQLGRAQSLVTAGQAMAPLLEGTTELAVDRASRLANLGARRRQDERALGRYLDRPELSDAVTALLRPDAEQWALHLRGAGGVGKTMLVRDLASGRFTRRQDLGPLAVARADFDHISADYPVRRPVQLLLELSDELALHTAAWTGADRALASFRAAAVTAHEALSDLRDESGPMLDHPQVQRALDRFGQAVERIPRPPSLPPVLLIVDTCEELAKADPGNPAAPAVLATLRMIEQLHQRVPAVRVLLCGRRPLPRRDYLAGREVSGFTLAEARDYLRLFSSRPLPDDLSDAIIRQSAAVDEPVPQVGTLPDRISPFDLALHLKWADDDPRLDARQLARAGPDAYVQVRVVDRLKDPVVRSALPYLALLGRCRVTTLLDAVQQGRLAADGLVARISEQEWVDVDGDPPAVLSVRPALARRLVRYFEADEQRPERDSAAAALSSVLDARVRDSELTDIDVDELLAALRLLPPARAAALWDDLVRRVEKSPGRWSWMHNVVLRVQGAVQEEQWATSGALEATVTAACVAARRRANLSWDAAELWDRVRDTADGHPDPAARALLAARAALGRLGGGAGQDERWAEVQAALRGAPRGPELSAATVDAAHRLLEAGAVEAAARLTRVEPFRVALAGAAGGRVRAWALLVLGRSRAEDDPTEAAGTLALAESATLAAAGGDDPVWADWVPPADLLARVRLERGLLAGRDQGQVSQLPLREWQAYAAADLRPVDRERLASLCLQLRLGRGPLAWDELDDWARLDSYQPDRLPTASAHDLVPPLFATLATAEVPAGRPERALALVKERRTAVLALRDDHQDESTLRAATLARVWLVRRLRLPDEHSLLKRQSALENPTPLQLDLQDAARRAMAVVHNKPPAVVGPEVWSRPEGYHAWWQCQVGEALPKTVPPVQWVVDAQAPDSAAATQLELDIVEMRVLGQPGVEWLEKTLAGWLGRPPVRDAVRSPDPWRAARAQLRAVALDVGSILPTGVPARQLGELAFEEAELLALRVPAAAGWLFEIAARAYADAGDRVGHLLALVAGARVEPDRAAGSVGEALALVRRQFPDVAEELAAGAGAAGSPWQPWAAALGGVLAAVPAPARSATVGGAVPPPTAVPASISPPTPATDAAAGERPSPSPRSARWTVAGAVVGVAAALLGLYFGLGAVEVPVTVATLAAAAVGLALVAWTANVLPVVRGRGIGARLAPHRLQFLAVVRSEPDEGAELLLRAGPAPPGGLPALSRLQTAVRVALLTPVVRLGSRSSRDGYRGLLRPVDADGRLEWTQGPGEHPAWWRRDADRDLVPSGEIVLPAEQEPRAWEQLISAGLGVGAAGRVDWLRRHQTTAWPVLPSGSPAVALHTPSEWLSELGRLYGTTVVGWDEPAVTVRHAIGRALATSAGGLLDTSGETRSGSSGHLLDVTQLARGDPALVVLQAEPVDESVDVELLDDRTERLTLASDLIEAGVPAVLVLPALRADLARDVVRWVADFAAGVPRYDALRSAWTDLRRALRPDVDPAVLDDLVLIVNRRWH